MLNKGNTSSTGSDDDSSGSEYVLLEAEDTVGAQDEALVQEETETAFVPADPAQLLVEESSDLLLEQFVDGTATNEPESTSVEQKESVDVETSNETGDTERVPEELVVDSDDSVVDSVGIDPDKEMTQLDSVRNIGHEDTITNEDKENEEVDAEDEVPPAGDQVEIDQGIPVKEMDEDIDPESADENSKESREPTEVKEVSCIDARDFKFGTRREVNGAAAVFGIAGLLIGGPLVGFVSAAASAHIAANKPCQCATFTRRCGGAVSNIGNLKPKGPGVTKGRKPHLWDVITNRLVTSGDWTERRFSHFRRIKPQGHVYPPSKGKVTMYSR